MPGYFILAVADPQLFKKEVIRERYRFLELIAPVSQEAVEIQRQRVILEAPDPVHVERN